MNIQYNSFHDRGEPGIQGQQNYDLSAANGCTHPTLNDPTDCVSHIDYNLDLRIRSTNRVPAMAAGRVSESAVRGRA
jgi:hypothetical protein